ncbi:porin family protein [Riemerella columbina]|uniref:porin family protein n=1 Tax=Riemerella columbina TaxID=103810 RepID=UPI00266F73F0|nr:porin family protein [Riemerella columbina]WKS94751.1 PorT family protein [Riemerella columbina]
MRKTLLLGALALFGAANAQVKYGVKAGYNLSNVSAKAAVSSAKVLLGNKSGFSAGAFVEYGLGNNLSLQGEVLYTNVGAKATVDPSKISKQQLTEFGIDPDAIELNKAEATLSLNQISVPVSLKYTFNQFSLLGGFDVNFKAGVSTKIKADGQDVKSELEQDAGFKLDDAIKNELAGANFGLHLGGEYMFNNNIFVDARYNFGISSLNKNYTDYVSAKQRYFQVSVGYKF